MLTYFVPILFVLLGLGLIIRPDSAVRIFHAQWKDDVFSFNRRLANPANIPRHKVLFRLIGALWILFGSMILVMVHSTQR